MAEPDDDRSSGRTDPLIANPVLATGETGQIERPGDDRSPWSIGILLAIFASLISGLVTVALTRDDAESADMVPAPSDVAANSEVASEASGTPADAATAATESGPATGSESGTAPNPTADPAADAADVTDERLPGPGFVRVTGLAAVPGDLAIDAACEVHLPLAPSDDDAQVSSYLFRTPDGVAHVVDRRFGERDDVEALVSGMAASFSGVADIGDSGAFVAEFSTPDGPLVIAVNPELDGGLDCDDSLVTNEQGQLAFPYTRIVMAACTSGEEGVDRFVAGVTSEGGRFTARSNGADTFTLTFSADGLGGELDGQLDGEFVDTAASSFENGDRLGYSGVVTDGDVTLDITVDFTPSAELPCSTADGV